MIQGRGSGSGKYSFHETHTANRSVMVSHMPDDGMHVRIAFRYSGEVHQVLKLSEMDAELLWASLKRMAVDLKWEDRMASEILEDEKKK